MAEEKIDFDSSDKLRMAIEQFKIGEFTKNELKRIEVEKKQDFPTDCLLEIVINHACNDMMARTLRVRDKGKGGRSFKRDVKATIEADIKMYFNKPSLTNEVEFDSWHHKMCKMVLSIICDHYEDSKSANGSTPCYGKAQKIVNMMFKYLYCFANEEQREKFFHYCHMPIDSVVLVWIKEKEGLSDKEIPAWSELEYSDSHDGKYYTYYELVSFIHNIFKDRECRFTPLQAEFIIWPNMKLKSAAEDFLDQLEYAGYNKKQFISPNFLLEDLKSIHDILSFCKFK